MNLRYIIPREIPFVMYNGSNYDFHFAIQNLADESEANAVKCLGENNKKHMFFSNNRKK